MLRNAYEQFTSLVLEGEPGIGKTTISSEAIDRATGLGYQVLSARATRSETQLALTGVADLLTPVDPAVFRTLPEPQRHALDVALLRVAHPMTDRSMCARSEPHSCP